MPLSLKRPGFQGAIQMMVGISLTYRKKLFAMLFQRVGDLPGPEARIAEETDKKDFFEQFAGISGTRNG